MSRHQFRFIMISSVLYIALFGIGMSKLTNSNLDTVYIPLIFYIIWYISSASTIKFFIKQDNYQGFFNSKNYMSERNVMPY